MPSIDRYQTLLDWIATQQRQMLDRVIRWAGINTGTENVAGIERLVAILKEDFQSLHGKSEIRPLAPHQSIDSHGDNIAKPLGPALIITQRRQAPFQILLAIHTDTVYPATDPFQQTRVDGNTLHGPGVTDAKGGIAVMLTALEALERSEFAPTIGWQVILNPDEEIGSPGSSSLFAEAAQTHHIGLLFEPSLPDGSLVDRRKGSGNFSVVIRGRSAHAGRDFGNGRSAVVAAAELTLGLHQINQTLPGVTINIGAIEGGGPSNVVPDLAICRFNARTVQLDDQDRILELVDRLVADLNTRDGISAKRFGEFASPAKVPDKPTLYLLDAIIACGRDLGLDLNHHPSGGACDGNRLSAAGLPNIDSLGVRGADIHTPNERMVVASLVERAKLTALTLFKLATGDIDRNQFSR